MSALTFIERHDSDSDKWGKYPPEVLPAWVADADYTAAEPILAALRARVAHGVFGYATPPPALLETTCIYFKQRWGWEIDPQWLLPSPGLGAAIHNSCRMAEGGGVLTPQPIYHVFRSAPSIAGAQRVDMQMTYDSGIWHLPPDAMEQAVHHAAGKGAKIFQLCNPHNPNGKVYTREELLAIGEFCCRHDLLIFSDEVHADLILDDDAAHIPIASLSPEIADRTITLQSPSKAYNIAGLNLAFVVISNPTLRARYLQAAQGKVIAHLNPFGYVAAAAAYSGACADWLQAQRTHLRTLRDRLAAQCAALDGIWMPHLQATYLAWLDVRALQLADAPAHFLRHGLGLSAGETFGDANFMRVNFACSPQRFETLSARLSEAVHAAAAT